MSTYARGTCLAYSPDLTNAFTVKSCLKGWRTSLNVPSMYQVLARARVFSCSCLANSRWRISFISRSERRKPRVDIHQPARSQDLMGVLGRVFDIDGWPVLRCNPVWVGLHTGLQSVLPIGPICDPICENRA